MTTAEGTIKDSEVLSIEWEPRSITAGDVREKVSKLWRLFMSRNTPETVTDTMRRYYEEYATKGKKAVKQHFEYQCLSTCGYKRAHDHSFQCWLDKFELEYLISRLGIDISKETAERKRNLEDVLEGYNGWDNMRKQEKRGEEEEQ